MRQIIMQMHTGWLGYFSDLDPDPGPGPWTLDLEKSVPCKTWTLKNLHQEKCWKQLDAEKKNWKKS